MTAREIARKNVIDSVTEAATKSHGRNYHKLHVWRYGSVSWFESDNPSSDIIDAGADGFRAVRSVARMGTGGYDCNCDHCKDAGYANKADAIADAAGCDLSDIQESMLGEFDAIEVGYFDDESQLASAIEAV